MDRELRKEAKLAARRLIARRAEPFMRVPVFHPSGSTTVATLWCIPEVQVFDEEGFVPVFLSTEGSLVMYALAEIGGMKVLTLVLADNFPSLRKMRELLDALKAMK